jgi:hypothetical protein
MGSPQAWLDELRPRPEQSPALEARPAARHLRNACTPLPARVHARRSPVIAATRISTRSCQHRTAAISASRTRSRQHRTAAISASAPAAANLAVTEGSSGSRSSLRGPMLRCQAQPRSPRLARASECSVRGVRGADCPIATAASARCTSPRSEDRDPEEPHASNIDSPHNQSVLSETNARCNCEVAGPRPRVQPAAISCS